MNASTMYYNKAFDQYIRNKATVHTDRDLEEGYREEYDSYDFPRGFDEDYAAALAEENLFRRRATLVHTTPGDMKIQTIESTAEAVLCDERMAYDEQADSFDTAEFGAFKLASLAKLRREFIADQHFDLQTYLKRNFCRRFGRAEERLLLVGIGVDQPTGLLTSAEVGVTAGELTYDDVIKLYLSVKPEYRRNGTWIVNDETALVLRTLKDENGAYLWDQSSGTILGKPVEYSMYMPDAEAGSKPIAFGDLSYFWMLQREPLAVRVLEEKYLLDSMIGFVAHERFDGKLIRPDAVKTLQIAG